MCEHHGAVGHLPVGQYQSPVLKNPTLTQAGKLSASQAHRSTRGKGGFSEWRAAPQLFELCNRRDIPLSLSKIAIVSPNHGPLSVYQARMITGCHPRDLTFTRQPLSQLRDGPVQNPKHELVLGYLTRHLGVRKPYNLCATTHVNRPVAMLSQPIHGTTSNKSFHADSE